MLILFITSAVYPVFFVIFKICAIAKSIIAIPPIIPTIRRAAGPAVKKENPKRLEDNKMINNSSTVIWPFAILIPA